MGKDSFVRDYKLFEDDVRAYLNKLNHELVLTAMWKLLPMTGIFIEVKEKIYDYYKLALFLKLTN